ALVLLWEHVTARPESPAAINRAFFLANVIFSLGVLVAVVGDLWL
ncbi:MAG: 4-hydroxybenzoate octaprenyltransferase, partial [Deinococcus sp.]|nr:4-hydroxybenzoate octaprenyltransferase [Deinococcus sp.]